MLTRYVSLVAEHYELLDPRYDHPILAADVKDRRDEFVYFLKKAYRSEWAADVVAASCYEAIRLDIALADAIASANLK